MANDATIAKSREQVDFASTPALGASLAKDAGAAGQYLQAVGRELHELGLPPDREGSARARATKLKSKARELRESFFRRHAAGIYDDITRGCTVPLRLADAVYKAADTYPGLLPTRAEIAAERALKRQIAKEGKEIDQGLFVAYVLADERCGRHLVHAMLKPKREAEQQLSEFRRTGRVDLGSAIVERKDNIGEVTLTNPKFLNAEDDVATAALETSVDLVLLDDAIEVGVLRGAVLEHPKYKQKRVFNAGINLTHLYYGQISFIEFFIERELGLVNKIYRGHWMSESYQEQFEDYIEKPWLAVVESFAIGGGCQLLCVMDRVIAEPGSYFNLPASKEGFIPGAANLRLPRLVGSHLAKQGIFFERPFVAGTPEGMMICDEVVPAAEMDASIKRNTEQMVRAGLTSAASNRKALRVGQEPLDVFRRYMATYSRQQSLCLYDQKLIDNLEHMWEPERRQM